MLTCVIDVPRSLERSMNFRQREYESSKHPEHWGLFDEVEEFTEHNNRSTRANRKFSSYNSKTDVTISPQIHRLLASG